MEPTRIIIDALIAGATAKDAHNVLKNSIQNKFKEEGKSEEEWILEKYENNPKKWETALIESLKEVGADKDDKIIEAATDLKKVLNNIGGDEGGSNAPNSPFKDFLVHIFILFCIFMAVMALVPMFPKIFGFLLED